MEVKVSVGRKVGAKFAQEWDIVDPLLGSGEIEVEVVESIVRSFVLGDVSAELIEALWQGHGVERFTHWIGRRPFSIPG